MSHYVTIRRQCKIEAKCIHKNRLHFLIPLQFKKFVQFYRLNTSLFVVSFPINSISDYWKSDLPKYLAPMSDTSAWLNLADFYEVFQSPNVYYYDSFSHLIELLTYFRWKDDSKELDAYKTMIRTKWKEVLVKIM